MTAQLGVGASCFDWDDMISNEKYGKMALCDSNFILWSHTNCWPKTVNNQITLPKKVADLFPDTDYFDVELDNGVIILRPVEPQSLSQVQQKLSQLGITESDGRKI